MKAYRGLLFEEGSCGSPKVISFPDDWKSMASIIGAEYIELTRRYVGDTLFTIVADDSGRLKQRRVTAWGSPKDFIVGSIIVTKLDDEGEDYVDLTDEDIELIGENLGVNTDTYEIVLNHIAFHPRNLYGVPYEMWEAAAETDREAVEQLRIVCMSEGLEGDDVEDALERIRKGIE